MSEIDSSTPATTAGPRSGFDLTKFRKGLLAFCIFLLGVNIYRWIAGLFETNRFEHLRGVALAAALVAVIAAGLVRRPQVQKVLLAVTFVLVLAFFILFFAG